jgi:predicted acylesterase/phospholipase RssA
LLLGGCTWLPAQTPIRFELVPPDYRLEFYPKASVPGQRRLVLALGGGAGRAVAHAGVLEKLQQEGIPIAGIAGTSMGACLGAVYATGYSGADIASLMEATDLGALILDRQHRYPGSTLWEQENDRATYLSFQFKGLSGFAFAPGASSGLELGRMLQALMLRGIFRAGRSFDRLRVPFRAVSTDLQTGRPYAPDHGDLPDVVRASMCIPGIFAPVVLEGHQHLDGALVQNLPVETARAMDPQAVVLAVEIGGAKDETPRTNLLQLAARILDVTMEERTSISRKGADLALRAELGAYPFLDFKRRDEEEVAEGRRIFDLGLESLEKLLYGPEGEEPAPPGAVTVNAPAGLKDRIEAIAAGSLPPGPRLRRHYLRFIRRIHAAGLAQRAELRFTPGGPVLDAEAYPPILRVDLQAPAAWRPAMVQALAAARVETGRPFNPVDLGRSLDLFLVQATRQFRPLMDFTGTGFEPATGTLALRIAEIVPESLQVSSGALSRSQTGYLESLLAPVAGRPLDSRAFAKNLLLAEARLDLEQLEVAADTGAGGPVFTVTPHPDRRIKADGIVAFETAWGLHVGGNVLVSRLFGSEATLGLHASDDQLQDHAGLEVSKHFRAFPQLGWRFWLADAERHFPHGSLQSLSLLDPGLLLLDGRTIREQAVDAGLFTRVGREDRGLVSLDFSRRWSSLHPGLPGVPWPDFNQVEAAEEWDSFDRYLFPTAGTLVRVKAGAGWGLSGVAAPDPARFQFAYGRLQQFWPVLPRASLEAELETGLGWNLPYSRWFSAGGPSFLAGTPSAAILAPSFGLVRLGLPVQLASSLAMTVQAGPRLDWGYLGEGSPAGLRDGLQVKGLGCTMRSEFGRWYLQLSVGHLWAQGTERIDRTRVDVLLGAHPFDLWREW